MRWRLVALVAFLPLVAVQVAHTRSGAQQPSCELACRVNPFTAPAGCDCSAPGGEAVTPVPAEPVPQTQPAPPVVSQPTAPPPASTAPGVPSCELACKVNPFTAPASCDCAAGIAGRTGGGGTAGPAPAASTSPASIAEDGMVSVGELLDYMEQLYRSRIAGVQNYYFLERMVVGQSPQASAGRGFGVVPASFAQAAPQAPLIGVDTMVPVLKSSKKVDRNGHPAMKNDAPGERARQAANRDPDPFDRLSAEEEQIARAAAKDPTLLLGGLASVAALLSNGAGDALRKKQDEIRAELAAEQQDEDAFAEDILGELLELKRALQRQASWTLEPGGVPRVAPGRAELFTGTRVYPGVIYDEPGKIAFKRGPRCAAPVACTTFELANFFETIDETLEDQIGSSYRPFYSLVWRPSADALADFQVGGAPPADSSVVTAAELWLPVPGGYENFDDWVLRDGSLSAGIDRPVRMQVVLGRADGGEGQTLDRVYGDFRPVQTGPGLPRLFEPHRIREQLGRMRCERDVDLREVGRILLGGEGGSQLEEDVERGRRLTAQQRCAVAALAAVDRIRSRFTVNQPPPSAADEALMIQEESAALP